MAAPPWAFIIRVGSWTSAPIARGSREGGSTNVEASKRMELPTQKPLWVRARMRGRCAGGMPAPQCIDSARRGGQTPEPRPPEAFALRTALWLHDGHELRFDAGVEADRQDL